MLKRRISSDFDTSRVFELLMPRVKRLKEFAPQATGDAARSFNAIFLSIIMSAWLARLVMRFC